MRYDSKLARELKFYRSFHKHSTNVILHVFGIPTILLMSLSMLKDVWYPLSYITGVYYFAYYTNLDGIHGAIIGSLVFLAGLYFHIKFQLALSLWLFGWIGQFIGHYIEKHKPALFSNFMQAIVLAPYFAIVEIAAYFGMPRAQRVLSAVDSA